MAMPPLLDPDDGDDDDSDRKWNEPFGELVLGIGSCSTDDWSVGALDGDY